MIQVPSTPPTTTVLQIPVGQAFLDQSVSPAVPYMKIAGGTTNAVRLVDGQASTQPDTKVVAPAPAAEFKLYP